MEQQVKNINSQLKIINKVLKYSPYETQKNKIRELFENKKPENEDDILLRIIVIDSCYSTNMNRRLFGFNELVKLIKDKKITKSNSDITNVENFKLLLDTKIGIDKKGKKKGHAFSLLTKYTYFLTEFNTPIYDSLVLQGLISEFNFKKTKKPSIEYFEKLTEIKEKANITFDELDKYFWVTGKIRNGSLSLLINDSKNYINLIKKLFENDGHLKLNSKELDKEIAKRISDKNYKFQNTKLRLINELAIQISNPNIT